jgi:hypothetical protein
MPQLDVVQEMFVAATPPVVAARLGRPDVRRALWPDLAVTVSQERGLEGQRYAVAGSWHGTAELWLSPCLDGVLVHAYLRVDRSGSLPAGSARPPLRPGRSRAELCRRDRHMRRALWVFKDELEAGREPGEPPALP